MRQKRTQLDALQKVSALRALKAANALARARLAQQGLQAQIDIMRAPLAAPQSAVPAQALARESYAQWSQRRLVQINAQEIALRLKLVDLEKAHGREAAREKIVTRLLQDAIRKDRRKRP